MLSRKNYIKSPVEIREELLVFFRKNDPLVIFDIGCCEAEDSIRYSDLFPASTVYAFEPRADNCAKAKELISEYKKNNIVLENLALSNKNGVAEFFLSEGDPEKQEDREEWNYGNKSSSLLPPSEQIKTETSWLRFNKKVEVDTVRLEDYVMKKGLKTIDFAHIDVQGAELMVLEGAGVFIDKIKLIWLEVESVELYKGQPLKNDVERFMQRHNFVNILDTVNAVTGDQLYVNRNFFPVEKTEQAKKVKKTNNFFKRFFK